MAEYSVRLYLNTGFNGVNIPDSPAQLNKCSHIDLDPVYLLQNRGLTNIVVKATWAQVEKADYIKIGNWFYSIPANGAQMQSETACSIALISDPITSAGGFEVASNGAVTTGFEILDGVTQRCTVRSDEWGEYTNDDPLIVPQEPLQIQTEWLVPTGGNVPGTIDGDPIFIESTIDLSSQSFNLTGKTYTDSETSETVTVPQTAPIRTASSDKTTDFTIDGSTVSDGTGVFCKNDKGKASSNASEAGVVVEAGLQAAQALGIAQGSVLNQWRVPKEFCGGITISYPFATGTDGADTGQRISVINGVDSTLISTISPDYANPKNKRLLYGLYNKYGMITCSGSSSEFKPEDLGGETAPSITYKSDPRPKGKPYYRFTTINGSTEFWRNCCAGSEWENVPLIYQGASGSALTRLNFDNERKMKSLQKSQYEQNYMINQVQTAAGIVGDAIGTFSGASNGISGMLSGAADMVKNAVAKSQYEDSYRLQKANELSNLYQSTDVYAPSISFPYNADILRDVKHNGVLIYKYRMSDNDVSRIDKLLTMYGYQTSEALTPENFGRRKHFDYVACSTVSITGLPKWWCDEIATQLKVGVRVWHELPNVAAYNNNPVRS